MVQECNDKSSYEKAISDNKKVVVDFTATWCGPCKRIAPVYEELANDNSDITFIKVDVDQNEYATSANKISGMPTFKAFLDGQAIEDLTVVGANADKVKELVAKLKAK